VTAEDVRAAKRDQRAIAQQRIQQNKAALENADKEIEALQPQEPPEEVPPPPSTPPQSPQFPPAEEPKARPKDFLDYAGDEESLY
jgi:outer membrane protein TolC